MSVTHSCCLSLALCGFGRLLRVPRRILFGAYIVGSVNTRRHCHRQCGAQSIANSSEQRSIVHHNELSRPLFGRLSGVGVSGRGGNGAEKENGVDGVGAGRRGVAGEKEGIGEQVGNGAGGEM